MRVRPGTDRDKREQVLTTWYRQSLKAILPDLIAKWQPVSFKALMDQFMPQWRLYRNELNQTSLAHEEWAY